MNVEYVQQAVSEARLGLDAASPRAQARVVGIRDALTPIDLRHVELFRRFLRGERSHEVVAWALAEPMSSANDPSTYGMGV